MTKNELNELRRKFVDLIIQARLLRNLDQQHPLHQKHLRMNYENQCEVVKKIKSISSEDLSDFIYETVSFYVVK